MKVMIVSMNHAPDPTGIGRYVGDMVGWLDKRGAEVRVVAAPPYYPAWRIAEGWSGARYEVETHGRTRVTRCPLYVPPNPTAARRLLHLASFAASSAPVILRDAVAWRPDIVFAVAPPLACAPVALAAARLCGALAWLHVQDFEVEAAFGLGLLEGGLACRLATGVEGTLLRSFDRVSTISAAMEERLAAKGVPSERRVQFPNWVDTTEIRPLDLAGAMRTQLGVRPDAHVVLYSGNFGRKQGLEVLIDAARLLPDDGSIEVLVCGDGADRVRIESLAEGVRQLRLLPLQPASRLNELLNVADVHVLPQRPEAEDLVMPSKLATMMASGRPVVTTARPASEVARTVACAGVVVPPGDSRALAEALLGLCRDTERRRRLGRLARDHACMHWDREAVLAKAFAREFQPPCSPPAVSTALPEAIELAAEPAQPRVGVTGR